ncbi:MAG TPA: response regulator transcription factor [Telluria sp.]|jgi:DNA-binding NarL/FixJ family response regulator
MINVMLADDHRLMREGLRRILCTAEDISIAGEATNGHEVLAGVRAGGFDVLLLDLTMPGRSGIELIRQIHDEAPTLPIVVLTMHPEEHYAVRAIRAGALGYLTKENVIKQVVDAIRTAARRRPYISNKVAEELALSVMSPDLFQPHLQLSDRERQVFSMLIGGNSVSRIAHVLQLSVKTVSAHKANIMQKMEVKSLAEMVQYAIAHELLPVAFSQSA